MIDPKVIIPMLRKLVPATIAQDIVGVQPMSMGITMLPKYRIATNSNESVPEGYIIVDVNKEVSIWIEQQELHMWKHGDLKELTQIRAVGFGFYDRYIISEELFSWLTLRWS